MAYYSKGVHSSSGGNRVRPYALMLLLAFGAALVGVMVLHKLRERRIYNLLVKEKDRDLLALQLLWQKERDYSKEMKRENAEMKAKIYALRNKKMELDRRVLELQSTTDSLKEEQKMMESALEEKLNEIKMLKESRISLGKENPELIALTQNLKQKEAEIEDLRHRLEVPVKNADDPSKLPVSLTANVSMAIQNKTEIVSEEKDEESHTEYQGGKHTIEDAKKEKLNMQRKESLPIEDASGGGIAKKGKKNEDSQNGAGVGITDKETNKKIMDGKENKIIKEAQPAKLENNIDGGDQDFHVKQLGDNSRNAAGVKGRHGHLSRTKGKRWRTIVQDRLLGNNEIFENHAAENKISSKVHRDVHKEPKDRIAGRVSNDKNVNGNEEMEPSKDKAETKLLKPENPEDGKNTKIKILNETNHQAINGGIYMRQSKQRLNEERQSLEEDNRGIQLSWSRRNINKVEKNDLQSKTGTIREESGVEVQKQVKDPIDDGDIEDNDDDLSKESQSDFEDEKEEYKEEIDESEFPAVFMIKQ
ncbi:hypothetical protein L6164_018756 [Bauhinia variegata]|uniref:Uncharacterized protein n=1 Tax=Bauhinia variegata TaxID=167791 RepID=A0ACB9NCA8_BAUVA|nr:hypothetical protein L6164_018756 [Bauhinia variegata]